MNTDKTSPNGNGECEPAAHEVDDCCGPGFPLCPGCPYHGNPISTIEDVMDFFNRLVPISELDEENSE